MSIEVKAGDKYAFRFTLQNKKKSAIDLTGATAVYIKVQPYVTGSSATLTSCVVINEQAGIVDYPMSGLTAGRYVAEMEIQYGTGDIKSSKNFFIEVEEDLPKDI